MHHALLLIDLQNDYFPAGKMALHRAQEAGGQAALLLGAFRASGRPVVHIQHVAPRPDAPFFVAGTAGADIVPMLAPLPGETVLVKAWPNSFRDTGLLAHLQARQVSRLTVAGMMTQRCVDTTVRAAFDLGLQVDLAHDACATRDLSFNGVTVSAEHVQAAFMAALGVGFARVLSTAQVCAGLAPA